MNVLQANKAYYPVLGGIETIVQTLCEGLSRCEGISVRALVCNGEQSRSDREDVVNGVPVTYAATSGSAFSMPLSLSFMRHLAQTEADLVHVHSPFPLADLALMFSMNPRRKRRGIVVSWHNDIVRQKRARAFYVPLLHRFLSQVGRVIVATPHHITSSHILPEYREKCEIIPYGIDLSWVSCETGRQERVEEIWSRYGRPLVLFVGRLVYYKGLEYLLEAMHAIPDASLVIVGSGPLDADLRGRITQLSLQKRVSILPPVDRELLHAFYDACDVFVLPSSEPTEGFGIVQVEAMACGKPVVATNLPTGVTYVNQDGVTGLIVPPKDSKALGEALGTLISDTALRTRLGQNARLRAFGEFTVQRMIERTVAVYRDVLGSLARRSS